jgi:predicted alpha/beta-fold hydrolase
MPIISSTFHPQRLIRPAWLQTIAASVLSRHPSLIGHQETLTLADGDSLELAWHIPATDDQKKLAIITHGLEGSDQSSYVIGLTRALNTAGYAVLNWNMRGCGRHRNNLPTWYHSGFTDDLRAVVAHAANKLKRAQVSLIGISVGGNIVAKYLGEEGLAANKTIASAVIVSAPLDLESSAKTLAHPSRAIYMRYLLRPLRERIREKAHRFPDLFSTKGLDQIKNFYQFDQLYTAPYHGFNSVAEYWSLSSGIRYLADIRVPTLILSAKDDPFLGPECYPISIAQDNSHIILETPPHGGHVGFMESISSGRAWLERRAVGFLSVG